MSHASIQTVFNTALQTFATANSLKVAWENVAFDPPRGAIFLSARMSARTSGITGMGANGRVMESGNYQVNVNAPTGLGMTSALAMADLLEVAFKRATSFTTSDSKLVVVKGCQVMPAIVDQQWITVPVLVDWFSPS